MLYMELACYGISVLSLYDTAFFTKMEIENRNQIIIKCYGTKSLRDSRRLDWLVYICEYRRFLFLIFYFSAFFASSASRASFFIARTFRGRPNRLMKPSAS